MPPGGALADGLRRLDLLHKAGALNDREVLRARERLMESVMDAEILSETPAPRTIAKVGAGGVLALAALGLGAIAIVGATQELLICVCLAALATIGFAACWEA